MSQEYMSRKRYSSDQRVLSNLDPNTISHIPQAAKRHQRLSLVPTNKRTSALGIGAPRVLNPSFATKSNNASSHISNNNNNIVSSVGRKSSLGATSTSRSISDMVQQSMSRSSMTRRKSLIGGMNFNGNNRNSNNNRASIIDSTNSIPNPVYSLPLFQSRDPRPLRDRNYQATLHQEIYDYLSLNKFDIEMKHPLYPKTIKTPTQKDFVFIFQWLYHRIDPGYKFSRSIEQEVYFILKTLEYPYIDSINKSQISAVGGSNWPIFLGMLHWFVNLNIEFCKFDDKDLNDFQETLKTLPNGRGVSEDPNNNNTYLNGGNDINDSIILNDDIVVNKLFTKYVLKSYRAYLHNEDDFSEFYNEMESSYKAYSLDLINKVESLQKDSNDLKIQTDSLSNDLVKLNKNLEKSKIMENDVIKFTEFVEKQKLRKDKWPITLTNLKNEIDLYAKRLIEIEGLKKEILDNLNEKGFTISDIDKMNQERDKLTKSLDSLNNKINSVIKTINDKQLSSTKSFEILLSLVDSYNVNIYKITNALGSTEIVNNEEYKNLPKFDIKNFDKTYLSDDKIGLRPDEIIPEIKELELKSKLLKLKSIIFEDSHRIQDESIKLQEKLDILRESIENKKDEFESLESKLTSKKLTYDEIHESMITENSQYSYDIEKYQKDLRLLSLKSKEKTSSINQSYNLCQLEFNEFKLNLNEKRSKIHKSIENAIEFIISFKIGVQTDIEKFEDLVISNHDEQQEILSQ
ncbi:hypothetical protein B5S32_g5284 [[Candida] boidinii]|nr:hypothetical protein B5S32_g5284 [[Candida] boidinii]